MWLTEPVGLGFFETSDEREPRPIARRMRAGWGRFPAGSLNPTAGRGGS